MNPVVNAITRTIPITQFNRGYAGKIFDEIKRTGPKVVMKNNTPEAVIVPPDEYIREQEELENLRLWKTAIERFAKTSPESYIPIEALDKEYGFTKENLIDYENIELE